MPKREEAEISLLEAILKHVREVNRKTGMLPHLVDEHACVALERHDRNLVLVVRMKTLEDWTDVCPECSFLLDFVSSNLDGRRWADVALTMIEDSPHDMLFVSGKDQVTDATGDTICHTMPFFLATQSG